MSATLRIVAGVRPATGLHSRADVEGCAASPANGRATLLRPRPLESKAAIVGSVEANVWPLVADGTVKPIVHTTFPLDDVRRAHEVVEESSHIGKVLLRT